MFAWVEVIQWLEKRERELFAEAFFFIICKGRQINPSGDSQTKMGEVVWLQPLELFFFFYLDFTFQVNHHMWPFVTF